MKEESSEKSQATHTAKIKNVYPEIKIHKNTTPNRFYAVPLVGFLVKIVILLPVYIEAMVLAFIFLFMWIINSLVILFTGKYWDPAYDFFTGLMQFWTKIYLYMYGLVDKYPGFGLNADNLFELHIAKPEKPNRLFAIPLFGLIARMVMLIPYSIFAQVMGNGSWVAMLISWFPILVYGRFPESTYEFESDTVRVNLASFTYMTGLKDTYPSFTISMNHQTIKILLIIAGALLTLNNWRNYATQKRYNMSDYNRYNNYNQKNYNQYNRNMNNNMYQNTQDNQQNTPSY
jgi:hypothetical protein